MRADKQARNVKALPYLNGSGNAVAIICKSDVHEYEIRVTAAGEFYCLFCRGRGTDNFVA